MSLPDPRQYNRESAGPLTYLNAVRAVSGLELPWASVCTRYMDGTSVGACAQEHMESDAMLLCEAWDYLERMPEPTDWERQTEREALILRLRQWGKRNS